MEIVVKPRRTVAARVGAVVSTVLMLAVLLVSAGYLIPSALGYQRYIITGGSMTGTYDKGSVVFEKKVPSSQLQVGDVITYMPPPNSGVTNLVTHRILTEKVDKKSGDTVFRTKGDFNPDKDPWTFTLNQTDQPVVQFSIPYIGWVFLFLADPRHRMWTIGGPAAAVALMSLVQAASNARKVRAAAQPAAVPAAAAALLEPAQPVMDAPVPVAVRALELEPIG